MKKAYAKPEIIFENFSMSTNIAGDCDLIIDNQSKNICAYEMRGYSVFTSDLPAICTTSEARDGIEDGAYNNICYHVPLETTKLFNS